MLECKRGYSSPSPSKGVFLGVMLFDVCPACGVRDTIHGALASILQIKLMLEMCMFCIRSFMIIPSSCTVRTMAR